MTEEQEYLLAFLKDWLEWAQKGGKRGEGEVNCYHRSVGLCASLYTFCRKNKLHYLKQNRIREALKARLKKDYPKEYLYPFGGERAYSKEFDEYTAYLNRVRLAWVRKTIQELES